MLWKEHWLILSSEFEACHVSCYPLRPPGLQVLSSPPGFSSSTPHTSCVFCTLLSTQSTLLSSQFSAWLAACVKHPPFGLRALGTSAPSLHNLD